MKERNKKIQLSLVFIGFLLIILTYYFYPKIIEIKNKKLISEKKEIIKIDEEVTNTFENVEYKGLYNINEPFTVKSEKAYISEEDSNVIYMENMHVILYVNDGRIINITSDSGTYNKVTYDCYFIDNVKATDSETIILSNNLDLISSKDTASIYNNVEITGERGSLFADRVDYNFKTKYYRVSMFENNSNSEKVKIKVIQ